MTGYMAFLAWGVLISSGLLMVFFYSGWSATEFDKSILNWFWWARHPLLGKILGAVTWLGSLVFLVPATLVLGTQLWRSGRINEAYFMLASLSGMVILTHLLKILIARPRPSYNTSLIPLPIDLSFPSAHTAQITVFVLAVLLVYWPAWSPAIQWAAVSLGVIVIFLVGISRLYLQVHYPTDVLASIVFSFLWVLGCIIWLLPTSPSA